MIKACICPHPPVIIPEIGGFRTAEVSKTIQSMELLSKILSHDPPEIVIVISPHTSIEDDFTINSENLSGDLSMFGFQNIRFSFLTDKPLISTIIDKSKKQNLHCSRRDEFNSVALDHGIIVPIYFLVRELSKLKLISLSVSMRTPQQHFNFGKAVFDAVREEGKHVLFLASGDLSHRLFPGAPAGYSERGKEFDKQIVQIVQSVELQKFIDLNSDLSFEAGECGLKSFQVLAGYMEGVAANSNILSYEGPFGVGYLVAYFESTDKNNTNG